MGWKSKSKSQPIPEGIDSSLEVTKDEMAERQKSGRYIRADQEESLPEDGEGFKMQGHHGETTPEAAEEEQRREDKRRSRKNWRECIPCCMCYNALHIRKMRMDGTIYTAGMYCVNANHMTTKWHTCDYAYYAKGLQRSLLDMDSVMMGGEMPEEVEPGEWQKGQAYLAAKDKVGEESVKGGQSIPKALRN